MHWKAFCGAAVAILLAGGADAQTPTLVLEAKIQLGDVSGRIDHLALDPVRGHLAVAELGNNSVSIVDLASRAVLSRIPGFSEPQGVAYLPWVDRFAVASGGDGTLRLLDADTLKPAGELDLGEDADNLLADTDSKRLLVAYGEGLAILDPGGPDVVGQVALDAHPEGLDRSGSTVFVNVPGAGHIAVVDETSGEVTSVWPTGIAGANFPVAVDAGAGKLVVAFRNPAGLGIYDLNTGASGPALPVCSDADNVFADQQRHRLYVSCGDGHLNVFEQRGASYELAEDVATAPGARTGFFDPASGTYFLAVPRRDGQDAAIWVYRALP